MSTRLRKDLVFYRRYHSNKVNTAIHIVGIPTILLSSLWLLTSVRVPSTTSPFLNLALPVGLCYWVYYSRLDPPLGISIGAIIFACAMQFSVLAISADSRAYHVAWALWSTGWIAQFIGHGVFEKRAPALVHNLEQALLLAPYFAVLEILSPLGIRRDVMLEVDERLEAERRAGAQVQTSGTSGTLEHR